METASLCSAASLAELASLRFGIFELTKSCGLGNDWTQKKQTPSPIEDGSQTALLWY